MVELILRWCVLAPTAVTLLLLVPTLRPWRRRAIATANADDADREPEKIGGARMVPLALAVVYVLTHLGVREDWRLSFPPVDAKLYLVFFAPIVALMAVLVCAAKWSRWWMRLFVFGVIYRWYFPLLLSKLLSAGWSSGGAAAWLAGLTIGAIVLTLIVDEIGRRLPVRPFVFALGLYVASSAGLFALMGSLNSGSQLGGVATSLGILFLLLSWKRESGILSALAFVVVFLLIGNAGEVYFFSYAIKPTLPLLLWLSVPIWWWLVLQFAGDALALRPWRRVLLLTVAILLPMSSAGVIVYRVNQADAEGAEDTYQYEEFR